MEVINGEDKTTIHVTVLFHLSKVESNERTAEWKFHGGVEKEHVLETGKFYFESLLHNLSIV